jgi:hypothetical protein
MRAAASRSSSAWSSATPVFDLEGRDDSTYGVPISLMAAYSFD